MSVSIGRLLLAIVRTVLRVLSTNGHIANLLIFPLRIGLLTLPPTEPSLGCIPKMRWCVVMARLGVGVSLEFFASLPAAAIFARRWRSITGGRAYVVSEVVSGAVVSPLLGSSHGRRRVQGDRRAAL